MPVALLPVNVLFTTVTFSSWVPMAPPLEPLLPVKVLPLTVAKPELPMPAPEPGCRAHNHIADTARRRRRCMAH